MPRSPLFDKFQTMTQHWIDLHGWEVPAYFGSVEEEYWALKKSAGVADLSHRGRLLVRGEDAPRFLHGMVTNEVTGLEIGRGNYTFLLNVRGHILADARILRLDEKSYLLDCEPQSYETIWEQLDRHIIADDVALLDQREELACFAVEGPLGRDMLRQAIGTGLPGPGALAHVYRDDLQARFVEGSTSGDHGYWILAAAEKAGDIVGRLLRLRADIIRAVGFQAMETCRIEAGIPRYGVDVTDKNLLQETGQMQAVSFTKGCYIGQEVVERVRSRGHANRTLVHLLVEERKEITPETQIVIDGEPVGSTGSSAYCFSLGKTVAFGYVRREYAEPGKQVMVGSLRATVAELPTNVRWTIGPE
ncbi:MAG: aminomethyl transferase family protein [Acidobacteria bacterium]|nr:aminomethyl transferase family protein [Acidobacteriota bacterium]